MSPSSPFEYGSLMAALRRMLGCLLLYGRRTPPPSITMLNGRVQVWIRGNQDEAFRIFDLLNGRVQVWIQGNQDETLRIFDSIRDALGEDRA